MSADDKMGEGMNSREIQTWLAYWGNAKMVDLRAIQAFDQVHQARKFCACMREGVFHPSVVTDLQIWNALCRMREDVAALKRRESEARPLGSS
jgi:hypothetical protein